MSESIPLLKLFVKTTPPLKPFPLLKLPSFAQDLIIRDLDAVFVLELTFHSKQMKHLVSRSKYTKIPADRMTWPHTKHGIERIRITLPERSSQNTLKMFETNGIHCILMQNKLDFTWTPTQQSFLIQHLLAVFNVKCDVYESLKEFENLKIFKHVKKFSRVVLDQIKFSPEQIKFVLEDIDVDHLNVLAIPLGYPEGNLVFKHRELRIAGYPNTPFLSILNMKSEYLDIRLTATDSTAEELIELTQRWISGGMKQLKRVIIRYNGMTRDIQLAFVAGIDKMEDIVIEKPYELDRIITRQDGKKASIDIAMSNLYFIVL